jgi:hypothetical protein
MGILASFALILGMMSQAVAVPADWGDVLSFEEQAKISREKSVDGRTKIYRAASIRIQKNLQQFVSKKEFESVPDTLKLWTTLLAKSLEDIETNLQAKKKPRSLINYEIQIRKTIVDIQGYKIAAPVDQQDAFDSCLAEAEKVRKRFVNILFELKS